MLECAWRLSDSGPGSAGASNHYTDGKAAKALCDGNFVWTIPAIGCHLSGEERFSARQEYLYAVDRTKPR